MKFKVGDKVLVTAGKDKGKTGEIVKLYPNEQKVLVEGVNFYTKHVKPMPAINRPGEKIRTERPLPTANVAIINDQGEPDRIGYQITKDGKKIRIYKKTGKEISQQQKTDKKSKKDKKSTKKSKK